MNPDKITSGNHTATFWAWEIVHKNSDGSESTGGYNGGVQLQCAVEGEKPFFNFDENNNSKESIMQSALKTIENCKCLTKDN